MRSLFVPSKSSRHRTAALSLYRALVKASNEIELPRHLQHEGPRHPVAHLVKKRFQSHKKYTSLRLVYSTMTSGYKFLTLLTKAKTSGSPEQKEVFRFLKTRTAAADQSRSTAPVRKPKEEPSTVPKVPLLRNVAGPGESPRYVANPRPENEQKPKRMPHMAVDCFAQPFIRFVKPQPKILSQTIGRRRFLWSKRVGGVVNVETALLPASKLEDEWEKLVDDQLRKEKLIIPTAEETSPRASFQWSALVGKLWWEYAIERTWEDWVARGEAMHRIVETERANRSSTDSEQDPVGKEDPTATPEPRKPAKNVRAASQSMMPVLDTAYRVRSEMNPEELKESNTHDPFSSSLWEGIVEAQDYRIKRWYYASR